MLKFISRLWKQYRYRFVPWIALNLKDRTMRQVSQGQTDQILPDVVVQAALINFFTALHNKGHGAIDFNQHLQKGSFNKKIIIEDENHSMPCSYDLGYSIHEESDMHNTHHHCKLCNVFKTMSLFSNKLIKYMSSVPSGYPWNTYGQSWNTLSHVSLSSWHPYDSVPAIGMCQNSLSPCPLHDTLHKCTSKKFTHIDVKDFCQNIEPVYMQGTIDNQKSGLNSSSRVPSVSGTMKGSQNQTENVLWKESLEQQSGCPKIAKSGLEIMYNNLGFCIERHPSIVPGGGTGVCVTRGTIPKHTLVAIYPGTVYFPAEAIFFQSLRNPFIFRCIDRVLIDGKDKGLSGRLYKSCCHRDRVGPMFTSDMSWLSPHPANPMAIGQYINNQSPGYPANVAYQEFDVPLDFPFHLRQYIPNNFCSAALQELDTKRLLRTVVLVSLREINEGEELFSSYFTVVY